MPETQLDLHVGSCFFLQPKLLSCRPHPPGRQPLGLPPPPGGPKQGGGVPSVFLLSGFPSITLQLCLRGCYSCPCPPRTQTYTVPWHPCTMHISHPGSPPVMANFFFLFAVSSVPSCQVSPRQLRSLARSLPGLFHQPITVEAEKIRASMVA